MEQYNIFVPEVPSKREELLKEVVKSKVVSMIRYDLEPKEQFLQEYGLDEKKAFSLSEGAFVIEFSNGISLGFSSDEEICSIITWAESYYDDHRNNQLKDEIDLFPIDSTDPKYSTSFFSSIINETLIKYEIIKQEPYSATFYNLPREVGLCLIFSNGSQMVISHQLTKEVPNDFTILEWGQIDAEIYQTLYKSSKFWKCE